MATREERVKERTHALDRRARRRLWLAFLVPPFAFLLALSAYAMVPFVCDADQPAVLHGWMLLSLLVDVGAGVLGWRDWRLVGRDHADDRPGEHAGGRLLAVMSVLGSGFFALMIVAQWLAIGLVPNCIR